MGECHEDKAGGRRQEAGGKAFLGTTKAIINLKPTL